MRTSVHACVRDVFAIYDDNSLPRLIMIIIKIIILYFIQIRTLMISPQRVYRLVIVMLPIEDSNYLSETLNKSSMFQPCV